MDDHRHEPQGIRGSSVVCLFFLTLIVISVLSYLVFRYLLNIPAG